MAAGAGAWGVGEGAWGSLTSAATVSGNGGCSFGASTGCATVGRTAGSSCGAGGAGVCGTFRTLGLGSAGGWKAITLLGVVFGAGDATCSRDSGAGMARACGSSAGWTVLGRYRLGRWTGLTSLAGTARLPQPMQLNARSERVETARVNRRTVQDRPVFMLRRGSIMVLWRFVFKMVSAISQIK